MNSASLLQMLNQRIEALGQAIDPIADHQSSRARFDEVLFHTKGKTLKDYLAEVQSNMHQLTLNVEQGKRERVSFLAERLVAQIAALQRELATKDLRRNDPLPAKQQNYYQQLSTHQDYERRLQSMIQDREAASLRQTTLASQQKLQREVAALEGRLQRCRQALTRIERMIERQERGLG